MEKLPMLSERHGEKHALSENESLDNANVQTTVARTVVDEASESGAFIRTESKFRNYIHAKQEIEAEGTSTEFVAAPGRYHLFVSLACPWAHRCMMVRKILHLEDIIPVSVLHPTWQYTKPNVDKHCGWVFHAEKGAAPLSSPTGMGSFDCAGCTSNSATTSKTVRDMYEMCDDISGKYTVPFLWDTEKQVIVNNESSEICRMLNGSFREYTDVTIDLYPMHLREKIDKVNELVYESINDGVYQVGFSRNQKEYDKAIDKVFKALDIIEDMLAREEFLCGNEFTEADIRLFVSAIRFDEVYSCFFKCNHRSLYRDYPNIWRWMKKIYHMEGFAETVDMTHIKTHYYTSIPTLNHYAIIPKGPGIIDLLES